MSPTHPFTEEPPADDRPAPRVCPECGRDDAERRARPSHCPTCSIDDAIEEARRKRDGIRREIAVTMKRLYADGIDGPLEETGDPDVGIDVRLSRVSAAILREGHARRTLEDIVERRGRVALALEAQVLDLARTTNERLAEQSAERAELAHQIRDLQVVVAELGVALKSAKAELVSQGFALNTAADARIELQRRVEVIEGVLADMVRRGGTQ